VRTAVESQFRIAGLRDEVQTRDLPNIIANYAATTFSACKLSNISNILKRLCQILPGFYFFVFRNIFFLYRARLALRPTPNLEDQVSVYKFPSDRVAQAPGSLFVAFYDLQGYGGGILTRRHTGVCQ
jgi:hypothetical protein